jgi:predicted glycosyltransferase
MIWFDLDNSPHVPLFRPIFAELDKRGEKYIITARDFAQTIDLLKFWELDYNVVGKHGGKNKLKKVLNLLNRSRQLRKFCKRKNISLAVSHGSRTQPLAARSLGIKAVFLLDYEFTTRKFFESFVSYMLMPKYIPDERLRSCGFDLKKVIRYDGFKEELYLKDFVPDPGFRKKINVPDSSILIVFRPPGMTGHYHDERSEQLLVKSLEYFSSFNDTTCLIINRGEMEKEYINSKIKPKDNIIFQRNAVDGLQLLHAADIAVSGGGTMNRESALLGTKTYSIFTGKRPYLDEYLQQLGRLNFINTPEEVSSIPVEKTSKKNIINFNPQLAETITGLILEYAK